MKLVNNQDMSHRILVFVFIGVVSVISVITLVFLFHSHFFDSLTSSKVMLLPSSKALVTDKVFPQTIGDFSRERVSGPDTDCSSSRDISWVGFSVQKEVFDVCVVSYGTEYSAMNSDTKVRVVLIYLTKNREKTATLLQRLVHKPTAFGYKGFFLDKDSGFSWFPAHTDETAFFSIYAKNKNKGGDPFNQPSGPFNQGEDLNNVVTEYFVKQYPSEKYSGKDAFEVIPNSGVKNTIFPEMISDYSLEKLSGKLGCEELCTYSYSAEYKKGIEKVNISIDQISDAPRTDAQEKKMQASLQKIAQHQKENADSNSIIIGYRAAQAGWYTDQASRVTLTYELVDVPAGTRIPMNGEHPLVRHFVTKYPPMNTQTNSLR